jgi:thioredoxin reductase (NADPH)
MYDFIIIGGGISGLSAAMYASRLGLKTLTLTEMPGGLITTTHLVENWPGTKSISGPDLGMAFYEHAQVSGAEIKMEKAQEIQKTDNIFKIKTASNEYEGKSLLIATGTHHRKLGVPGEKELENKGVSYCALCDGGFFKEKNVCVVGGGDSAAKEAIFLSEHAKKVYLIVRRDVLRAEPINADHIDKNDKIEILYKTEIEEIIGTDKVEKVKFQGGKELPMDGVFLAIGHIAQTDLAKNLGVDLNSRGEIKINRKSETNVPGVFAAGDCVDTEFKQAITGSAEGVSAAYFAYHFVNTDAKF